MDMVTVIETTIIIIIIIVIMINTIIIITRTFFCSEVTILGPYIRILRSTMYPEFNLKNTSNLFCDCDKRKF